MWKLTTSSSLLGAPFSSPDAPANLPPVGSASTYEPRASLWHCNSFANELLACVMPTSQAVLIQKGSGRGWHFCRILA